MTVKCSPLCAGRKSQAFFISGQHVLSRDTEKFVTGLNEGSSMCFQDASMCFKNTLIMTNVSGSTQQSL